MTKIEIINAALGFLGQEALSGEQDASTLGNVSGRMWHTTLDEVFSATDWRWCRKRLVLTQSPEESIFILPSDLERIVSIRTGSGSAEHKDYRVEEGRVFIPNTVDPEIIYSIRPDLKYWPVFFRAIVVRNLARNIGSALRLDGSQARDRAYSSALENAKRTDYLSRPKNSFLPKHGRYASAYMGG